MYVTCTNKVVPCIPAVHQKTETVIKRNLIEYGCRSRRWLKQWSENEEMWTRTVST